MSEQNIILKYRIEHGRNNKLLSYKRMVDCINEYLPPHLHTNPAIFYVWATGSTHAPKYFWPYVMEMSDGWVKNLAMEMFVAEAEEAAQKAGEK